MAGTPGVAARLFNALARTGINVRAIAQGSSERNISVAIAAADATRALKAVHAGFYLSALTVSVGVIGPGNVGKTFLKQLSAARERLLKSNGLDLRVRATATTSKMALSEQHLDAPTLDRLLRAAVAPTFNMLSVDTDTSTSDTCAILANGLAGSVDEAAFLSVLTAGCRRMTEILARDGEGAEHLVRVTVRGALNETEAHVVAKSILNSPLVKTMVHGADPNVGRLLMAVGKCFDCTIRPETTDAWINGFQVVGHGERLAFDDAVVRETLSREVVDLSVSLGVGDGEAVAYGCDLTKGYVDENASYYSS
jgi:hypothetical protein